MSDYSLSKTAQLMKKPLLAGALLNKNHKEAQALVWVDFAPKEKAILTLLEGVVHDWQLDSFSVRKTIQRFETPMGPLVLVLPLVDGESKGSVLEESSHGAIKRAMGGLYALLESEKLEKIQVEIKGATKSHIRSCFCGLEIAAYRFKEIIKGKSSSLQLSFNRDKGKISKEDFDAGVSLGQGVNIARHAVNTPPNYLNPQTYSTLIQKEFTGKPGFKVTLWPEARLKKEKMELILAVGSGAQHGPCMVHMSYRPPGSSKKKVVAFTGKGITYDTGGLNLKPGMGMRNMKKDMGGSAALLGLCHWVAKNKPKQPMDFYFAIAENSVDEDSFRPGDVLTSRKGLTVEIHNTDAEGRLVLADALNVAAEKKPASIVNVATLTGAIKVGLGTDIGGLFCNNDKLESKLMAAAEESHDLLWPMPMYKPYFKKLRSSVADMVNASDGFGSSITAALFLEKFANDIPFAHLDIYSWTDSPRGSLRESGASGQGVELLVEYVKSIQ